MKRWVFKYVGLLIGLFALNSCVDREEFSNNPYGNFESLWTTLDEGYCFFSYKDVDWNEVHARYAKMIRPNMSNDALFQVLSNMLAELRDGHVNLSSTYNQGRYWQWYLDYPRNYSEELIEKYMGTNYKIAGGIKYCIFKDNIGYINYHDFSIPIGEGNLDQIMAYMALCDGLIIDVRNNGGGNITNSARLAARFTNEKKLVGYIQHKIGKGHNDFSEPFAIYIEPSKGIRWQKKVAVLTNRHCFSATNDFVNSMRYFPNVKLIGDQTGGGSGLPISSELPNGWGVRYSASPHLNAEKQQIEFGIKPDIAVNMTSEDINRGVDTIIESAKLWLKSK